MPDQSPYKVIFKPSADKALSKLPVDVQRRIVAAVEALAVEPRPPGVVKMAGDDNLWRVRVGEYRIVYEIHDGQLIVLVLRVAHRRDVYR
jgi:mRNA interferase RelE/StbE